MRRFTFVKVTMFLFSLLLSVGGAALLVLGLWVSVDGFWFLRVLGIFSSPGASSVNVGFFCSAQGLVLLGLGFLGVCGPHRPSKSLILLFFCVVLIIFIAEVSVVVVVFAYSSFAERILGSWATRVLQKDFGSDSTITETWTRTMNQFSCCGFVDFRDFVGSKFVETQGHFPLNCCRNQSSAYEPRSSAYEPRSSAYEPRSSAYEPQSSAPCSVEEAELSAVQGCFTQILESLVKNTNIVGGVVAGVTALEVAALVVSMFLFCHLDEMSS
ncbi:tetraspanin-1 [Boleophthalmus pectinirostris]|uniref:tetraspanin-1 n=1 Tax=Boleophthalmus pectinirostris TaxID=150288 RepID=UPI00242EBA4E|nr:tetraspanin-1 [Boleophthalmus pectinirostris]